MKQFLIIAMSLLTLGAFWSPPAAQAACLVQVNPATYADGTLLNTDICDTTGARTTTGAGASGITTLGTSTAAAPSLAEGAQASFSFDNSGNARFTMGTLISGEDQTNNGLMTFGGATRITTMGPVTSATSSAITTLFTGRKTFMASMGGASETKAFDLTIYGNWQNSTTGGMAVCRMWVPSTASITHIEERCKSIDSNFSFWYYTADVYTSASAANLTVYAMQ